MGERWVDVSHEALIRGWPRLRRWIDEDRAGLRIHRRLTEAAQEWRQLNCDEGVLYRSARLAEALEWREQNEAALNELERDFLQASIALQEQEQAARERLRRRVVTGLALGLVIALGLGGLASWQWLRAEGERDLAVSNYRTNLADGIRARDPTVAVALTHSALRLRKTAAARDLMEALYRDDAFYDNSILHPSPVASVATSATGDHFASGSGDGTARIWSRAGDLVAVLEGHKGTVHSVAFSPDGRRVLTGAGTNVAGDPVDSTARLWDLQGNQIRVLNEPTLPVTSVSFARDRDLFLAASADGAVYIWDESATLRYTLPDPGYGPVLAAAFSQDGRSVISGHAGHGVCVWSLEPQPKSTCEELGGLVSSVGFSTGDAYRLAATGQRTRQGYEDAPRNVIHVWDRSGREVAVLRGHSDSVSAATFSPDGQAILSASHDSTLRIWDLRGRELTVFQGHEGRVLSAAFFPDGDSIVSGSGHYSRGFSILGLPGWEMPTGKSSLTGLSDHSLRTWRLPVRLRGAVTLSGDWQGRFSALAFSPDGAFVLAGGRRGTAWVFDAAGRQLRVLPGRDDAWTGGHTEALAFSSDGRLMATDFAQSAVGVWDESGKLVQTFRGCQRITAAAFSQDGTRLLAGGGSIQIGPNSACLWDMEGNLLQDFGPFDLLVVAVALSPLDGLMAVMTYDNKVRLFDDGGNEVASFHTLVSASPHEDAGGKLTVAFSPDGKSLLTCSMDGKVRLWDLEGNLVRVFGGHKGRITAVAFSGDGRRILTGAKQARLWDSAGVHLRTFPGARNGRTGVMAVGFSSEGDVLIGYSDKSLDIWSVKDALGAFIEAPPVAKLTTAHRLALGLAEIGDVSNSTNVDELLDGVASLQHKLESSTSAVDRRMLSETIDVLLRKLVSFSSSTSSFRLEAFLVAQSRRHILEGETAGEQGDLDAAVAHFKKARALYPQLDLEPEQRARELTGKYYQTRARREAQRGEVDAAVRLYRKAISVDPSLQLDPVAEAGRLAAPALLAKGVRLADGGQIHGALDAYKAAQTANPELVISAKAWNSLCWSGSLHGFAMEVMDACHAAVALEPSNGGFRDSRGLALALTGDLEGAIDDFEAFAVWGLFNAKKEADLDRRRQWVKALRAGRNPIDAEALKALKDGRARAVEYRAPPVDCGGASAQPGSRTPSTRGKSAKHDVMLVTLGQTGHGKTVLAVAIDKVMSKRSGGPLSSLETLQDPAGARFWGMCIRVAHVDFESERRHYVLEHSPEDREQIKALITGVFKADAAILVVSLVHGLTRQAREQIALAYKVGSRHVVVYLNVGEDGATPESLTALEREVREVLDRQRLAGAEAPVIVGSPVKALRGDAGDLGEASVERLVQALDAYVPEPRQAVDFPFLMPIEDVIRSRGNTLVTGRVERGVVRPGDSVEIVGFVPVRNDKVAGVAMFRKEIEKLSAGDNAGVLLERAGRHEIARGQVLAAPGTAAAHTWFEGLLYLFEEAEGGSPGGLISGERRQFRLRTKDVTGEVLFPEHGEKALPGEYRRVSVNLAVPVAVKRGLRFVLREHERATGVGIITSVSD